MSESRALRLQTIRQILTESHVGSQEELLRLVTERGFSCTQSSISRDLADLGVHKSKGVYAFTASKIPKEILSVQPAGPHLVVIRTEIGAASRVAYELDNLGLSEVVGTIAGDDTIFVAVASSDAQCRLTQTLGGAA